MAVVGQMGVLLLKHRSLLTDLWIRRVSIAMLSPRLALVCWHVAYDAVAVLAKRSDRVGVDRYLAAVPSPMSKVYKWVQSRGARNDAVVVVVSSRIATSRIGHRSHGLHALFLGLWRHFDGIVAIVHRIAAGAVARNLLMKHDIVTIARRRRWRDKVDGVCHLARTRSLFCSNVFALSTLKTVFEGGGLQDQTKQAAPH